MVPTTPTSNASSPAGGSPPVLDRARKPPGILPRHTQAWVVVGVAVLMMGILAISGPSRPAEKRAAPPIGAGAIPPSQERIQDYRNRIDEEARRLAAAQAELEVAKRALAGAPPAAAEPAVVARAPVSPAPPSPDTIERERAQRDDRALFADNVALTLRPRDDGAARVAGPRGPVVERPAAGSETPAPARGHADGAAGHGTDPDGKRFRILEGTIIEAVLTNRLDGSFAGPVNALVTTAVCSHDRQHVLIPRGARLLGEAKAVASFGQQRLAVAFHRLILPDGTSATLDAFNGLNQVGETGLRDQVNRHYAELFGVSLAIGAIGGLAQATTRVGVDATASDVYRQGVATSASQSSLHILDRFLNVLPTVTIREGQRLKVYLTGDLDLPAYGDSEG